MSIRCDIGLFDANPSIDHQSVASTRQVIYGPSITDGHRLTGHRHRLAQVTSIYRQSIGDQLVTNLGTRVLWRPTEVSSRRTNRAALGLSNRSKQRNDSPNGSPSSANPLQCKINQKPMGYQSWHPQSANPFKCEAKPTHTSQSSQSCAKRCQSITNLMSIQCCPSASHMPIHCKPDVKSVPIHQSLIKTPNSEQIQRKSWSNTAPILAQSPNTAPHRSSITHCTHLPAGSALIGSASTQAMLIEFRDQLVTNLGTRLLWGPTTGLVGGRIGQCRPSYL